jgi:cyclophilin family peptidyl-prolyl cis-trans isomerase
MREEMPRWVNGFFAITGGLTLIGSVAVLIAAIAQSFPDDPPSAKCTWATAPGTKAAVPPNPVLNEGPATFTIETNRGRISVRLDRARTPCAVASLEFLSHKGFFADSNCHQIVDKLVQCGNPTAKGYRFEETSLPTGKNPSYPRRTVAMAASSGSQFYILSATAPLPAGSTVLGTVENGLDIIDGASELVIDSTSVA